MLLAVVVPFSVGYCLLSRLEHAKSDRRSPAASTSRKRGPGVPETARGRDSYMKKLLEWLLRRLGYKLVPASRSYRNLRELSDDPLGALYASGSAPFLIDVPLDRIRALEGLALPCIPGSHNPLVETAAGYLEGRHDEYAGSPLETFYEAWKPENAAEALGLGETHVSPRLATAPPYLAVLPWYPFGLDKLERIRVPILYEENRIHGSELGPEHGTVLAGPLSDEKGDLEYRRLTRLVRSIEERGYVEGEAAADHVGGLLLVRDSEWRVLLRDGNHRVAALAALGAATAPIVITENGHCPRRAEASSWPNVRSGLFTEDQALEIFDRMFEGRPPPGCPTHLDE